MYDCQWRRTVVDGEFPVVRVRGGERLEQLVPVPLLALAVALRPGVERLPVICRVADLRRGVGGVGGRAALSARSLLAS